MIFMKLVMPVQCGFEASSEIRLVEAQFGLNPDQAHFIVGYQVCMKECKSSTYHILA